MRREAHRNRPGRRDETGYALLEAMFSVIILSVGIMAVVYTLRGNFRLYAYQKHQLEPALQFAEAWLQRLESQPSAPPASAELDSLLDRYGMRVETQRSAWPGYPRLQHVRVVVRWRDGDRQRSLTLETLLPAPKQ